MKPAQVTGLGEPELFGKKSLFQPPADNSDQNLSEPKRVEKTIQREKPVRQETSSPEERIRMALDITKKSLSIIQEHQGRYRLENGHLLPKWKIISDALELYAQSKAGDGNEKSEQVTGQ